MRMTASWSGPYRDLPNTSLRREDPRPNGKLPSDRHPDHNQHAVVLGAVKVWPGQGGACGKIGATANLDSSCARRLCDTAGRGEETGFQVEQRNWDEGRKWRMP